MGTLLSNQQHRHVLIWGHTALMRSPWRRSRCELRSRWIRSSSRGHTALRRSPGRRSRCEPRSRWTTMLRLARRQSLWVRGKTYGATTIMRRLVTCLHRMWLCLAETHVCMSRSPRASSQSKCEHTARRREQWATELLEISLRPNASVPPIKLHYRYLLS